MIVPFVDTYGVFDLALAIRSQDLMIDMYEDPGFVDAFLLKLAEWCEKLSDTWGERSGLARRHYPVSDHGIDMLSPELYERFLVPVIARMNEPRGAVSTRNLHHCCRGEHLFPVIKKHFGLKHIEALTHPFVDIARVRRETGKDVWITAVAADDVTCSNPRSVYGRPSGT